MYELLLSSILILMNAHVYEHNFSYTSNSYESSYEFLSLFQSSSFTTLLGIDHCKQFHNFGKIMCKLWIKMLIIIDSVVSYEPRTPTWKVDMT